MLKYTGHPLVDVGIATIAAFVGKRDPAQVTQADLNQVADYITTEYVRPPLKSFLTVAFPNSGFTQPAFEKTPERRLDYAQRVLRSYRADIPQLEEPCVFTGEPAVAVAFGDKEGLPAGRAFRQHIPLITRVLRSCERPKLIKQLARRLTNTKSQPKRAGLQCRVRPAASAVWLPGVQASNVCTIVVAGTPSVRRCAIHSTKSRSVSLATAWHRCPVDSNGARTP